MAKLFKNGSAEAFSTESTDVSKTGNFKLPSGFNTINGIIVQPGYKLCVFQKDNQSGKNMCLTAGRHVLNQYGSEWLNGSYRLIKDCNHPSMMWDTDCNTVVDPLQVQDPCSIKGSVCYKNKVTYCNKLQISDSLDERCVPFCVKNPGQCDTYMKRYCNINENSGKLECSCLNSAASKYNPMCIDQKCIKHGYATADMIDKKCPSIIDCGIYHDIKETGLKIKFADSGIEDRCSGAAFKQGITTLDDLEKDKDTVAPILTPLSTLPAAPSQGSYLVWKILYFITLAMLTGVLFIYRSRIIISCYVALGRWGCLGAILMPLLILVIISYKVMVMQPAPPPTIIDPTAPPITGKRWGSCDKSDDCQGTDLGCYKTANTKQGRCMTEADCNWTTQNEGTISPNECSPF